MFYSIIDLNNLLSHIFVECSKQLFKLFIFSSAGEEINCIHSDVGFTRKGSLIRSHGVHQPQLTQKT